MSFWRQLAQERELRGVSLEEVVERTKISRTTLERMESGDPDHLPARAYLLGYLKSYAEAVGLDADDVILRFEAEGLEEGVPEDVATILAADSKPSRKRLPRWFWLLLGVCLAAALTLILSWVGN